MGVAWGFLMLALLVLGPSSGDPVRAPEVAAAVPEPVRPKVAKKAAPAAASDADTRPARAIDDLLAGRRLVVPVEGVRPSELRDTFHSGRGKGRRHQAIDIMAPRGTPVLAADEGRVAKISSNQGGGLSAYLVDPSGRLVYYYAHLDGYAPGLREGQAVKRGQLIGYVGSTGNAPESAPHLHFAVLLMTQERRWWGGEALNPYAALVGDDTVASNATVEQRGGRPTR
ncbi:M23 family metallopeptidase [Ramlibacter sp. PS3R-8]|uniref:M23 family metallopeptidase n=1 Tax=Ramlibacter sp. PS3R-8 TaxID=3133437 RepID=UPI0030A3FE57